MQLFGKAERVEIEEESERGEKKGSSEGCQPTEEPQLIPKTNRISEWYVRPVFTLLPVLSLQSSTRIFGIVSVGDGGGESTREFSRS